MKLSSDSNLGHPIENHLLSNSVQYSFVHLIQIQKYFPTSLFSSRCAEAEFGEQVDVVVPGQPGGGAQLAVGQAQHLAETRRSVTHLLDHPLRRHDVHVAHDLHRSRVHTRKTDTSTR